jgi:hypothetical protein
VFVLEKYRGPLSLRHKFRLILHGDFVYLKVPQQLKIIISAIAIYQKIISIFHPYDEIFTQQPQRFARFFEFIDFKRQHKYQINQKISYKVSRFVKMYADRGLFIELIRGKKVKSAVSPIKLADNAKIDLFDVLYEGNFLLALYFVYVDILYMINLLVRKSKKARFLFKNSRRENVYIV